MEFRLLCRVTETAACKALSLWPGFDHGDVPSRSAYLDGMSAFVRRALEKGSFSAWAVLNDRQIAERLADVTLQMLSTGSILEASLGERTAAYEVLAAVDERSPDPHRRLGALRALLALQADALWGDYRRAGLLARRLIEGIFDGRWDVEQFELTELTDTYTALQCWGGVHQDETALGWRYGDACICPTTGESLGRGEPQLNSAARTRWLCSSLRIARLFLKRLELDEVRRDVAVVSLKLGWIYLRAGDKNSAQELFSEGLEAFQTDSGQAPSTSSEKVLIQLTRGQGLAGEISRDYLPPE